MYYVSAQGVDERMINVLCYYRFTTVPESEAWSVYGS